MPVTGPCFFWYPVPTGRLVITDFGEAASDLQMEPIVEAEDALSGAGLLNRSFLSAGWRVRILLERFQDGEGVATSALERELQAMMSHLQRGNSVGFALDPAQVWAALARTAPIQGDTSLSTTLNAFSAWSASGALADGDEVVIESGPPDQFFEIATANGASTGLGVTIDSPGALFSYTSKPLVRHRDFWPVLVYPEDQLQTPIVTSDRRIVWTLDIELEYRPGAVLALWGSSVTNTPLPFGTTDSIASGPGKGRGLVSPDMLTDGRFLDVAGGAQVPSPYITRWF